MATIALAVGTVEYSAATWAQDTTQGSTVTEKPFTISLTPRLWYQIANGNRYQSNPSTQNSVDQTNFADYGLSLEVSARSLPDWSFILTGYYGAGSAPARSISFFPSPTEDAFDRIATSMQSSAFRRYDVEFLARYLVAPTISVTGGFRIFNFNNKVTSGVTNIFPNTFGLVPNTGQSFVVKQDNKFYLEEIGLLFSTPFSESRRHLLFGGTTLGLGVRTFNESRYDFISFNNTVHSRTSDMIIAATLDVYAGYQFLLTQSVALNIRYRAIMVSDSGQIPGQVTVNHGPEIGITTRF
jgi:hypothetical protein